MKDLIFSATKISLVSLVLGLIYMSINEIPINETYSKTLEYVIIFYFGQKVNRPIV